MEKTQMTNFNIIGIKLRTTNADMQAAKDIPALWNKFMSENISDKIENKLEDSIYAIYTNYESDYTGAYDVVIGYKVESLENIPSDMIGIQIPKSSYEQFKAEGKLKDNIVYNKWMEIWNTKIDRRYEADFEIYKANTTEDADTEVEILISVN
ncbi:GyrI-like domain-containing protein [uncultured Tenacibaculum sp.]|uniref:GyrI-like domain-containing protein n=1 Tax=uncultured Tenacibaculum sp. TaxID=174713 RepID=UPI0026274E31|nr:GyrI-like domain-containing protein [uncultured Tenacibaculum sp.]